MRQQDGLGSLQVGVTRKDRLLVPLRHVDQGQLESAQGTDRLRGPVPRIHPGVGRYLVVS